MEETRMQIAAEEKEVSKPAPYQLLGAFLEAQRQKCRLERKKLSIHRLVALAGMSNSTYAKVKGALA